MRQHVNPLSNHFKEIETIPQLQEIFKDPHLPLHLDIGCSSGTFLFKLASQNQDWNYLGIEIRERLVNHARIKLKRSQMTNLYFAFGNAENLMKEWIQNLPYGFLTSVSFNFPDPWFKKKHHKRRVINSEFIELLATNLQLESLIFIKSDVNELFQYMDQIICSNNSFQKIDNQQFLIQKTYNPQLVKTDREEYVLLNKMSVYEQIYKRI